MLFDDTKSSIELQADIIFIGGGGSMMVIHGLFLFINSHFKQG